MTLNNIKFGENRFCGPAVIAAITGKTTDEAADMIQAARLRRSNVTVINTDEMISVLARCGYPCHFVRPLGSLYMTCSFLSTRGNAIYIVVVPKHVVLIEVLDGKVYFLDNHTKQPMNAAGSARMMQRVTNIWKVTIQKNENG